LLTFRIVVFSTLYLGVDGSPVALDPAIVPRIGFSRTRTQSAAADGTQ